MGYDNLEFKNGYLESLPLAPQSVDVVLSNCVINLSAHKRRTFAEIYRVLAPGGRLIIADVVCDTEPPAALKNDDVLRGECLAGALTQKDLFGLLHESGFTAVCALKRFPYRQVQGHQFYSLTYRAVKPGSAHPVQVMYPGPLAGLVTERGDLLPAGLPRSLELLSPELNDLFILDSQGAVTNRNWEAPSCCPGEAGCCSPNLEAAQPSPALSCCPPPQTTGPIISQPPDRMTIGALGSNFFRLKTENRKRKTKPAAVSSAALPSPILTRKLTPAVFIAVVNRLANALCRQGHYVCDACHSRDALKIIEHFLLTTQEIDMIVLLQESRRHPAISMHGPEHHSLVPGIILAAYRNLGGPVTPEMLQTALRRGNTIAGGACAFLGVCGAAAGVGVAFSILLNANPLKAKERLLIKQITIKSLEASGLTSGVRCCQQECWQALRQAARLSRQFLPIPLPAEAPLICQQWEQNKECQGADCPLWPV